MNGLFAFAPDFNPIYATAETVGWGTSLILQARPREAQEFVSQCQHAPLDSRQPWSTRYRARTGPSWALTTNVAHLPAGGRPRLARRVVPWYVPDSFETTVRVAMQTAP